MTDDKLIIIICVTAIAMLLIKCLRESIFLGPHRNGSLVTSGRYMLRWAVHVVMWSVKSYMFTSSCEGSTELYLYTCLYGCYGVLWYQDTRSCVTGQETCCTQVCYFTGTAKLLFSTPCISITTVPICTKFMYFMPSI